MKVAHWNGLYLITWGLTSFTGSQPIVVKHIVFRPYGGLLTHS